MKLKLALIGKGISHSLSPKLQSEILGDRLESYDLLDFDNELDLPGLEHLAQTYDGVNITTPYKSHYFKSLKVDSEIANSICAINTISLSDFSGTNTDALAVEEILVNYSAKLPDLKVHLLGSGVMAKMTLLICKKLKIQLLQYTRESHGDLSHLNMMMLDSNDLVINSCSRSFIYKGQISPECHFWDYNYSFTPHHYLKEITASYQDGQDLLLKQAICAANFWMRKAKLNY